MLVARRLLLWLFVAAALTGGCSSDADLRGRGGAGGSGGGGGLPIAGAGGGAGAGGAGGAAPTGTRVFAGRASMLWDGPSCTGEAGATGDRWCAFVTPGSAGARNLFVVDVSRVAAGAAVSCDGGAAADPSCLLLTPALGDDLRDPTFHGTFFKGDTLVYYDDALVPYVWRPGMAAGRLLATRSTTFDVGFCTPAFRGAAVACLGLPSAQPDPNVIRGELLAGKADGPSEPLLTSIDTVIATNAADRGGTPRFSYGFPAVAGDWLAWTSRATPDGPEILKLQKADDPSSQITVASDVHAWDVSPDGTRWFWLSAIASTGIGMLQTAPFPGGAGPTDVQERVLDYGFPSAGGRTVVTLAQSGAIAAIADPIGAPATRIALDTQVQTLLGFGSQGHVAYAKHYFGANLVDLFVKKADGTGDCTLDPDATVPIASVQLSPDAGALLWVRSKAGGGFDGQYTRLADCSSMPLASGVVAHGHVGHGAVVFMDQFDDATLTGSMRFRTVGAGNALDPGAPTLVAHQVDTYAISGPPPGALLYTVNGSADADGVYVRWFGP